MSEKRTCCDMRRKVTVLLGPILPEELCGVPDTILADYVRFDLDAEAPDGRTLPVIGFRYCPWCGKPFTADSEMRTSAAGFGGAADDESGEEWKLGRPEDNDE